MLSLHLCTSIKPLATPVFSLSICDCSLCCSVLCLSLAALIFYVWCAEAAASAVALISTCCCMHTAVPPGQLAFANSIYTPVPIAQRRPYDIIYAHRRTRVRCPFHHQRCATVFRLLTPSHRPPLFHRKPILSCTRIGCFMHVPNQPSVRVHVPASGEDSALFITV